MKKENILAKLNTEKYAQPPSWEEIESFLVETKMKMYHFERFYSIPFNTLTQVKSGKRNLPAEYWHFIYERIKPTYGAGFLGEYTLKRTKNSINYRLTSRLTLSPITSTDSHDRTGTLT